MWGSSAGRWRGHVLDLAHRLDAKVILDYGCGKGMLKVLTEKFGYRVTEYDPGIPGKDGPPEPADLVACLDVIEHLEPACLTDVLRDIERLAKTGALLVIALYPAGEILPDGRNAHLILESPKWWCDKLAEVFNDLKWEMKFEHRARPCRNTNRVKDVLVVEITRS
jgi:SAM-dependent methyltransferase